LNELVNLKKAGILDPMIEEALAVVNSGVAGKELSRLLALCSDAMFQKAQYNEAAVYGEMSAEADPDNAEAYSCLGWAQYWLGINEKALENLQRAVELSPETAEFHYRTGSILSNVLGRLSEAENEFTAALEADPSHVLAWQQRGICRWNQGNREGAEQDYRTGAELGDSYCGYILQYNGFELHSPLEKVALARDSWAQNDSQGAVELLEQALESLSGSKLTETRLELADKLSSMKQNNEAELHYDLAIEEEPENPECHGRRGWLYYCISRDDEAERDFLKAMELDPENSRYPSNLGNLYAVTAKPREGLAVLDPAIEKDPHFSDLYYARALCRMKLGMDEEAKADFNKADFMGHRNAQNDRRQAYGDEFAMDFFSAGIEAGEQSNTQLAAENFARAAEMFEAERKYHGDKAFRYTSKSLHNLGYYQYLSGGLNDAAIENLKKALEMVPHYKDAWISLGNVYNSTGEQDQALNCYNEAVELQPNDGRGYYSRGRIHLDRQEFDAGAEDFTRAGEFYRRQDWQGDAYYNRARCHEGAGRIHEAISDYQQAFGLGIQQGLHESFRLKDQHGIE